jgi:hypothetical protein
MLITCLLIAIPSTDYCDARRKLSSPVYCFNWLDYYYISNMYGLIAIVIHDNSRVTHFISVFNSVQELILITKGISTYNFLF